nr:helix-turn-helix domain-containing protein [Nocardiopsis algeriensis]
MVFDAEGLSPREKCVLLAYCNYTDAHGYVWAGVPRVSDDTGASESTVKRVRKELQERGLLATKRRVDPRTGRSTSNITRINLDLLASMKRAPREYDDNVIEELTFEAEETPSKSASDLRIGQSDPASDLRIGQSDPGPGVNLTSPEGEVNLTPNSSDEPSGSSSSGGRPAKEDEEESPSAKNTSPPRGVQPTDLIQDLTDATADEALALWENIRPDVKKTPGGLIRHMAENGDLAYRLGEIRRQRASQVRAAASQAAGPDPVCGEHREPVPCEACAGLPPLQQKQLLRRFGPMRRPDLAAHVAPAPASTASVGV